MGSRECENGEPFGEALLDPGRKSRRDLLVFLNRLLQPGFSRGQVWGIEDRTQVVGHFAVEFLAGHIRPGILLQMELAALSGSTPKDGLQCGSQTCIGIAGDQAHTLQPALDQALEKLTPVKLLFAQRDRETQNLSFSV